MNLQMNILNATYSRSGAKFTIAYNPSVLVGGVMYYSKEYHSPKDFKLFTFSWRLGRVMHNLSRRVGP